MYHEEPVFSPLPPPPIDTDRRFNSAVTKSRNKFVTNKPPDIVQMEQHTRQELATFKLNQSSLRLSPFSLISTFAFSPSPSTLSCATLYHLAIRSSLPVAPPFYSASVLANERTQIRSDPVPGRSVDTLGGYRVGNTVTRSESDAVQAG